VDVAGEDGENAIVMEEFEPSTGRVPDARFAVKPDTLPTVKGNEPFGSWNEIVAVTAPRVLPFSVTAHEVPEASPVSVKVTGNSSGEVWTFQSTICTTFAPETSNVPWEGVGAYPVGPVVTRNE
jgi:hypothetical protein